MKAFIKYRKIGSVEELEGLLTKAQGGDLEAYGEIVQRFQDMAVAYARAILGDFHLAEDVAQEAFIEAYLNLSKVYSAHAFPGWLRAIVFKFCDRQTRKKRMHFVSLETAGELHSKDKGPAEALDEKDTKDLVEATLKTLPERERTVVNLFYINEFSQKEIAVFLEWPVSTVNFRLHSARKRLKKEWVKMTEENLKTQRPSKDREFTDKIQDDLQAVQKLHTGFLPGLKTHFSKALGRDVEVGIQSAHQRMYGHFIQYLGTLCCDYCFKMDPLKGWVYLDLSLPLCTALLDPEADGETVKREAAAQLERPIGQPWMSYSDISVMNEHVKVMVAELGKTWESVQTMNIHDIELETFPSFIYKPDNPQEPVIHIVIEVKSEGYEDLTLSLCYFLSTLEPALPELR